MGETVDNAEKISRMALMIARHRMGDTRGLLKEDDIVKDEDIQLAFDLVHIWEGREPNRPKGTLIQ